MYTLCVENTARTMYTSRGPCPMGRVSGARERERETKKLCAGSQENSKDRRCEVWWDRGDAKELGTREWFADKGNWQKGDETGFCWRRRCEQSTRWKGERMSKALAR